MSHDQKLTLKGVITNAIYYLITLYFKKIIYNLRNHVSLLAGVHHGGVQRVLAALQQGSQGGGHPQVLPPPHPPLHGGLLLHRQVHHTTSVRSGPNSPDPVQIVRIRPK